LVPAAPAAGAKTLVVRDARTVKLTAASAASELTLQARAAGCAGKTTLIGTFRGKRVLTAALKPRKLSALRAAVRAKAGVNKVRFTVQGRGLNCRVRLGSMALGGPAPVAPPKPGPIKKQKPLPDPATAPKRPVPLGAAVEWRSLDFWGDESYKAAFATNFDSLTPENVMKMEYLEPERGKYEFFYADSLVDFARNAGKAVRGHPLVWHEQLPRWITERRWSHEEMAGVLKDYITNVVGQYRGRVVEWDVVNEPFNEDGSYRDSVWYESLGSDFIDLAFRYAHAVDPAAKLYLNDFHTEYDGPKADATVRLVKQLKAKGVPIDGVGLQMHWDEGTPPSAATVQRWMNRYAELGVEVQITEMDVAIEPAYADHADHRANQEAQYAAAALACNAIPSCTRVTVWGVSDRYTWRGSQTTPLLLDADYNRKPAYDAVRAAFARK
jgi:endo-1,4-beta-xylanase